MLNHDQILVVIHWCLSAVTFMLTAYILPGFEVGSFFSALVIALVVGIANVLLRPLLLFLTLPFNIITLGLFTFVVNAIILRLCAALLPNFNIRGWWTAIFAAIILSIVGAVLHSFVV